MKIARFTTLNGVTFCVRKGEKSTSFYFNKEILKIYI